MEIHLKPGMRQAVEHGARVPFHDEAFESKRLARQCRFLGFRRRGKEGSGEEGHISTSHKTHHTY